MLTGREWQAVAAPTLADFEALAAAAWDRMPGEFRQMCGDLVIRVEDFAEEDVLSELELEDPFDLMGVYQGVSIDKKSVSDVPRGPDVVVLFRRAMLDYWAEYEETLGHLVAHVLIHEIGHHFGLSDDDMAALEEVASDE
jgi:predicted Zn-dependent protease with MMP-like domain